MKYIFYLFRRMLKKLLLLRLLLNKNNNKLSIISSANVYASFSMTKEYL